MASPLPKKRPKFTLTGSSPLDGHRTIVDGARLVEVSPRSIVSLSPFSGNEAVFNTAIKKLFNSGTPPSAIQAFERTSKNACVLVPSAHNQWFLCFDNEVADPLTAASGLLGEVITDHVAMTDQSDAWLILALTGPLTYSTLERICPIDCSSSAMPIGTTARTMMEHVGIIILRRPDDDGSPCFWLMSARSSAASFLHVITGSPPFTPK